jgi:hypothetical protein
MTANKKQLWLNRQFAGNISTRIIPWPRQITSLPDGNNRIRIHRFKWPYHKHGRGFLLGVLFVKHKAAAETL